MAVGPKFIQQVFHRLQEIGIVELQLLEVELFRRRLIYEGKILVVNRTHETPIIYFLDPAKHPDVFKI